MWASYKGHDDVVALLLEKGADVHAHGNYNIKYVCLINLRLDYICIYYISFLVHLLFNNAILVLVNVSAPVPAF